MGSTNNICHPGLLQKYKGPQASPRERPLDVRKSQGNGFFLWYSTRRASLWPTWLQLGDKPVGLVCQTTELSMSSFSHLHMYSYSNPSLQSKTIVLILAVFLRSLQYFTLISKKLQCVKRPTMCSSTLVHTSRNFTIADLHILWETRLSIACMQLFLA